ncbi:MAG TPA: hypothetical protein VKT29_12900 [Terriglobales bacterium]|nr:hypothetical protein [Terriglobales bacterium]
MGQKILLKSAISVFLLTLGAFTQAAPSTQAASPAAPPTAAVPQDENARKAKALIDQMIQALGGQAWLNVHDMREQGRTWSVYHGQPTGTAQFWLFWKYPDKERVELTKKRDWIIINNGDLGFEITFRGTAPEDPKALQDYLRRRKYSLVWVLRQWLNQPGVALFYEGQVVAAQKQAEQVTIMNAQNEAVTIDVDYTSHLPIKKSFVWRDPDRYRNEEVEIYDNYKMIQGVATPLSVTRFHNGDMTSQRFISDASYNQNLPDSLFQANVTWNPHDMPPAKKH